MAAGDLALTMLVRADITQASGGIGRLGTSLFSLASVGMKGVSNAVGNILFGLRNLGTEGTIGIDALKQGLSGLGASLLQVGLIIGVVIGAALVGIGIKSVQMAKQYEQSMNMVKALTGSNTQQMAQYDASVKQLAVDAGVAPNALALGLYNVLSASYRGAAAMLVLRLATEDAQIGLTSATVTTDALTNILRSFGVQEKDITRVNGEMLQTVTLGKATFEQYATTIVKSASAANQFHVSMEVMNAAWATMTSSGIRAAQASTDFQQSLKVMYGNINTVTASLHKNHIAFDEAKFNAMDYGHKILYLNTALEQANQKHVKITGVTIQASQAIITIAKHIGDYTSNLAQLSDKQLMAQKTQQAWAITQSGFAQTMNRVKATFDVLFITIGQQLLPILTKMMAQVGPIISQFTTWIIKNQILENAIKNVRPLFDAMFGTIRTMLPPVVSGFLLFIGLIQRLVGWATQNKEVMQALKIIFIAVGAILVGVIAAGLLLVVIGLGALTLAVGIVVGVIAGVVWIFTHWGQIVQWLQDRVAQFGAWIGGFIQGAIQKVVQFFQDGWNAIVHGFEWLYSHNYYFQMLVDKIRQIVSAAVAWLSGIWDWAVKQVAQKWDSLKTSAEKAWQSVSTVFSSAWNRYIAGPLGNLWTMLTGWQNKLAGNAVNWGANMIQGFVNGILSKLPQVANAAQRIVNQAGSFLGFHSPARQGEGRYIIQWGEGLVKGFIQGMQNVQPLLTAHISQMILAPNGLPSGAGPGSGNAFRISPATGSTAFALSGESRVIVVQVQPATAAIHVDGKKVGESVTKYQGKEVRIQGAWRSS